MNEAQEFLIKHGYLDLEITHRNSLEPSKWRYTSDAMMAFAASQPAVESDVASDAV